MAGEPIRIEMNRRGVHDLLGDPRLGQELLRIGDRIAHAASGHVGAVNPEPAQYTAELHRAASGRLYVRVATTNAAARAGEPVHHWLMQALGMGRF
jgi:hypothetical protein